MTHSRHTTGSSLRRAVVAGAVAGALVAVAPAAAHAGSTVNVGGFATCAWVGSGLAAQKVTITLDSGGSSTVGTSGLQWQNGLYRMSFPSMPRGGTGATVTVTCSSFALHPGAHSFRTFLKPDWRNTTGDTTFRNV